MKIIRLTRGEQSTTANRIYITRHSDGTASWVGAVGLGRGAVFGNSKYVLRSVGDAESEAINWAQSKGAAKIVIESDDA